MALKGCYAQANTASWKVWETHVHSHPDLYYSFSSGLYTSCMAVTHTTTTDVHSIYCCWWSWSVLQPQCHPLHPPLPLHQAWAPSCSYHACCLVAQNAGRSCWNYKAVPPPSEENMGPTWKTLIISFRAAFSLLWPLQAWRIQARSLKCARQSSLQQIAGSRFCCLKLRFWLIWEENFSYFLNIINRNTEVCM